MATKTETSDDPKIAFLKAFNKVQGVLEPVKKDASNPHFGSKYATLGAVWESVRGILTENGFAILQGGVQLNGKNYLRTTLYHVGGHSESFDYPLIEDTSNPQKVASSVTYSRRYAIAAILGLSTEDDDANAATHHEAPRSQTMQTAAKVFNGAISGSDPQVVRFIPSIVTAKPTSKGGLCISVKLPDGSFASSFDEAHQVILGKAKAEGKYVKLTWSPSKDGRFKNIGKIVEDAPVKTTEEVEPPVEDLESVPF